MNKISPAWVTLALTITLHVIGLAFVTGILWARADTGPVEDRIDRLDARVISLSASVSDRFDQLEALLFQIDRAAADPHESPVLDQNRQIPAR